MSDSKNGVLVKSVTPHSAALKVGIQKGDVIIAIDGQTIKTSADVKLWGLDKKPNDVVVLKLRRNNKVLIKKLKLKGKTAFKMHKKH
jgi:S1-C subfamily serine protease